MTNLAEVLRLIHNLVRVGTVADTDYQAKRVRVKSGDLQTDWLRWITPRAGDTQDWDPPTIGEQVVVFSPGGEMTSGIVLSGLFSDAHDAPSRKAVEHVRQYPDGAVIKYDHETHHLAATIPGSASLQTDGDTSINAGGDITIAASGDVTISGSKVSLNP